MQREKPCLDSDTNGKKGKSDKDNFGVIQIRQDITQIRHIKGAGCYIKVSNAKQVKTGTDSTYNNIVESSHWCPFLTN